MTNEYLIKKIKKKSKCLKNNESQKKWNYSRKIKIMDNAWEKSCENIRQIYFNHTEMSLFKKKKLNRNSSGANNELN